MSERLAVLLAAALGRAPLDSATLVVPVPLHAERERERGFNQAAALARALSARAGLRLDEWSLVRVAGSARRRAGMDARGRRETVAGAFEVARPPPRAPDSIRRAARRRAPTGRARAPPPG